MDGKVKALNELWKHVQQTTILGFNSIICRWLLHFRPLQSECCCSKWSYMAMQITQSVTNVAL